MSIIWIIVLIFSLEDGGQATTDTTLRLEVRVDEVIKSPRGTSILATYYENLEYRGRK